LAIFLPLDNNSQINKTQSPALDVKYQACCREVFWSPKSVKLLGELTALPNPQLDFGWKTNGEGKEGECCLLPGADEGE